MRFPARWPETILSALVALALIAAPVTAPAQTSLRSASVAEKARIFETSLRPALRVAGAPPTRWTIADRMRHYGVPGVSIAIISGGEVAWAKGYGEAKAGTGLPVTTETVFSVGSLSKTAAALTTLRLVRAGKLDLDRDVNAYLKRWTPPVDPGAVGAPVTLRGLMSHTAGTTVNGFEDYLPGEKIPTIIETLRGAPPAKNPPVRVAYRPGTSSAYSGGGTTIEQLVIEDVTGEAFAEVARREVFQPLGLTRTTFASPLPETWGDIAYAHDREGRLTALPRGYHTFAETAASGLWTTPTEYARMLMDVVRSYRGEPGRLLTSALAVDMLTEVGASDYGLGPQLLGDGADRRMLHTGSNESYQSVYEIYPERGEGVVIMTNSMRAGALRGEILRAVSDAMGWPDNREVITLSSAHPTAALTPFPGRYHVATPPTDDESRALWGKPRDLEIALRNDALVWVHDGRPYGLAAVGPQHFVDERGRIRFEFVRHAGGEIVGLIVRDGANSVFLKRTPTDRQ